MKRKKLYLKILIALAIVYAIYAFYKAVTNNVKDFFGSLLKFLNPFSGISALWKDLTGWFSSSNKSGSGYTQNADGSGTWTVQNDNGTSTDLTITPAAPGTDYGAAWTFKS